MQKEQSRKKPCKSCPFRRDNDLQKPNPGGSPPEVYIGQSRGPFILPCHKGKNYAGKETDLSQALECAGAAIFRANCEIPYKLPDQILSLPKDTETVFSNEREFLNFYKEEDSKEVLTEEYLDLLLLRELLDANVKQVNRK